MVGKADYRQLTTAVIFVDLRAAFHPLLREYVFTIKEPLTRSTLQRIFDHREFDIEKRAADLHPVCQERPSNIPEALRRFPHDIHKSIWFKLDPDHEHIVVTDRGTLPGSPLADLGLNLLMSQLMGRPQFRAMTLQSLRSRPR